MGFLKQFHFYSNWLFIRSWAGHLAKIVTKNFFFNKVIDHDSPSIEASFCIQFWSNQMGTFSHTTPLIYKNSTFILSTKLFLLRGKLLLEAKCQQDTEFEQKRPLRRVLKIPTIFHLFRQLQTYSTPTKIEYPFENQELGVQKEGIFFFPLEKLVQFWSLLLHECIYFPKVTWICFSQTFELLIHAISKVRFSSKNELLIVAIETQFGNDNWILMPPIVIKPNLT